jgi:glycosyltransferase involved in cell wall biosynthesis
MAIPTKLEAIPRSERRRPARPAPRLRIGIMLRHIDQHAGGVLLYTKHLLAELFALNPGHRFVLLYQKRSLIGSYADREDVEEVALELPGSILWDQLAVPWLVRRHRLDVVFNPKFSVPFLAQVPSVFVLHGAEWFTIPGAFRWHDRLYARTLVPWYCRAAHRVIAVTESVKHDVVAFTELAPERVVPIYNGFDRRRFGVIRDARLLQTARERYGLPPRFLLWVGQIYPPKNFARLLQAFAKVSRSTDHQLVIAGEPRWRAAGDLAQVRALGLESRVLFTGWVDQKDLPALYNLADLFVFPSLREGFGIPLLEAMACGCPIVTSTTGSPPEVVAGAALLVDPLDVESIAAGILHALKRRELREDLARRGLERAAAFAWQRCAREVLEVIEGAALAPRAQEEAQDASRSLPPFPAARRPPQPWTSDDQPLSR